MLYNRYTGIYEFGNNTYPQCIRRRPNLGHIFGGKSASYGPGNMVNSNPLIQRQMASAYSENIMQVIYK
jgi:hypothetical protein